ncbi:manganese/iron ABC transporter ATP-binding protein [Rhodoplanes roseus]|uniref:Iron ABC transporter permease n=1 Tax=Rhodoplanes roseus TaxID=29409 RepID=A0A327L257_9BRAD|nr:manganese/iron ABC transporter ATP-binding protein [Rhodoplanes roseus]RAI44457.1 iron ABC transporter permease [Rhodoplanes roseus]
MNAPVPTDRLASPSPASNVVPGTPAGPPRGDGILVDRVSVTYPNGTTAVRDASFALDPGTICALVGINGSGKSTVFKAIMGFVRPSAGAVRLCGMPVAQALKRNIVAYVPQSEDVDWNFPVLVEDVVMMGRYGHMNMLRIPARADRAKVDEALERVGMAAFRKRQIGELSGGQKKRVFLARALAQEGRIILLDEPFTGVDVTTEGAIVALLRELRAAGHVMLVSTHDLGSVPDFCDQVVLLDRTVLAAGATAEVFTPENLQRTFGGALRNFRLGGAALHQDADRRSLTVLTDDERPLVFYGDPDSDGEGRT